MNIKEELVTERIPTTVPEMMTVCPVCMEEFFDKKGRASKEVAKINCIHLVHDECLRDAANKLNADGKRYGMSGLRGPCGLAIAIAASIYFDNGQEPSW